MKIRNAQLKTVCGYTSTLPESELPEIAFAGRSNVGKSSLINVLMQRKRLARVGETPGKTRTINFYEIDALVKMPVRKENAEGAEPLQEAGSAREAEETLAQDERGSGETLAQDERGAAKTLAQDEGGAAKTLAQDERGAAKTLAQDERGAAEISDAKAKTMGRSGTEEEFREESRIFQLVDLPGYGYASVSRSEKAKWGKMIERYLRSARDLRAVFLLVDIRHAPNANDRQMYDWIIQSGHTPVLIATKSDKIKRSQLSKQMKILREGLNAPKGTLVLPFSALNGSGRDKVCAQIARLLDEEG